MNDKERFINILKSVKYFLLDMDGTVYLGDELIGEMDKTLDFLRSNGKKIVYLTNNSSKSISEYNDKLQRMNLLRSSDEVYTSGIATAEYLSDNYPESSVFLLGTQALKKEFLSAGINIVDGFADISVLSYDTELTYDKLCRFTYNVTKGSKYIATHPDVNCPAPEVFVPDVGAFMTLIESSTGKRPEAIIGKPFPTMGESLMRRYNASPQDFIMVGDRLQTDIKFGNNCGFNTLFVLSGECTEKDLERSDAKPTYCLNSLNNIIEFFS